MFICNNKKTYQQVMFELVQVQRTFFKFFVGSSCLERKWEREFQREVRRPNVHLSQFVQDYGVTFNCQCRLFSIDN